MAEIKRNKHIEMPYSLHDSRINRITVEGDRVTFYFCQGFYEIGREDCLEVEGNAMITLEGVDLDYCVVYELDTMGCMGKITGRKLELVEFINSTGLNRETCESDREVKNLEFEIVDETYGYNQVKFAGYLYHDEQIQECNMEFYFFGDMTYKVDLN